MTLVQRLMTALLTFYIIHQAVLSFTPILFFRKGIWKVSCHRRGLCLHGRLVQDDVYQIKKRYIRHLIIKMIIWDLRHNSCVCVYVSDTASDQGLQSRRVHEDPGASRAATNAERRLDRPVQVTHQGCVLKSIVSPLAPVICLFYLGL